MYYILSSFVSTTFNSLHIKKLQNKELKIKRLENYRFPDNKL